MGYHLQKLQQQSTKTTISKLRSSITSFNSPFSSSPPIQNQPPPNSVPISQPQPQPPMLTPSELTKINNLIPRLIHSNQLPTALHLTKIALSSNPPLHSLNLTPLITTLSSQQHLTHTISLLTHLLHTPQSHSHISPISHMLLSSYIDNRNTNHAFKLFRWLQRPGSPSPPDDHMFRLLIPALCRDGFLLQAIGAFRDMVGGAHTEFGSCVDCGQWLYRGLLSQARVNQAMDLNAALLSLARDTREKGRVLHVLDTIIADWME